MLCFSGLFGRILLRIVQILTDFGDPAVLLPLSVVFFIWLLATNRTAVALSWLGIVLVCNLIITALKVYFLACPLGGTLRSPSGHTGYGILVYGSITLALAASARQRRWRWLIVVLGSIAIAAIVLSRLVLRIHSPVEIAVGATIGGLALLVFAWRYRPGGGLRWSVVALAVIALLVAFAFHGEQLKAEDFLRNLGAQIGFGSGRCGYH
jgi:membrane-associated phospholipid phosphatase